MNNAILIFIRLMLANKKMNFGKESITYPTRMNKREIKKNSAFKTSLLHMSLITV